MMYGSWDIKFFVILGYFLTFDPPNNPEIQNFEKIKKIIILHISSINENHDVWFLRYGAWQTESFLILDHFLPFYPTNNLKNKYFEKMKKILEISFNRSVPKSMIICYTVLEIWRMMGIIFIFHFGLFFEKCRIALPNLDYINSNPISQIWNTWRVKIAHFITIFNFC